MNKSDRRVKGLGEVSIRVRGLDEMHKFYEEVVGLEEAGLFLTRSPIRE